MLRERERETESYLGLTSRSNGVSRPSEGEELTSMIHTFRELSIMTSKPKSSKLLTQWGIGASCKHARAATVCGTWRPERGSDNDCHILPPVPRTAPPAQPLARVPKAAPNPRPVQSQCCLQNVLVIARGSFAPVATAAPAVSSGCTWSHRGAVRPRRELGVAGTGAAPLRPTSPFAPTSW